MLQVVALETLHCKKAPDRKHPKGSDKVYVAAVTREQGNDMDEPHYLDVLFGARLGRMQFRRWQYPSIWTARVGFQAKVREQLAQGYVSIDWTESFYGLERSVQSMGEMALQERPAGQRQTPARRLQPQAQRTTPILIRPEPHEWIPMRRRDRPNVIVCAAGCGSSRGDPIHAVAVDQAPPEPSPARQRAPQRRPPAPARNVVPPPPQPQPLRPPQRERRGRNINLPR